MSDRFGQVKHDNESWPMKVIKNGECVETGGFVPTSRFDDECWRKKFNGPYAYPAPRKHFYNPLSGNNAVKLTPEWWQYVKDINVIFGDGPASWEQGRINNGGWINWASNKNYPPGDPVPDPPTNGWPVAEGITTIGAYHKILERRNGSSRVEAFYIKDRPPDPAKVNQHTHPWMFVLFRSIDENGDLGYAPGGHRFWFPLISQYGEVWLPDDRFKIDVPYPPEQEPEPMPTVTRAYGVDISKWNDPYKDDGIDEGWPELSFVIQKAWDGNTDYTVPGVMPGWQEQYDSIAHFPIKGAYGWYQTEYDPISQAETALAVAAKGLYDFLVVDYEYYLNQITEATARDLKAHIEHIRARTNLRVLVYSNGSIFNLLQSWLGSWMDGVPKWYAGGKYYGVPISGPIPDSEIPPFPKAWKLWQFSGPGNDQADELDFGTSEGADIDINIYNGTPQEMQLYFNVAAPDPDPEPEPDPTPIDEIAIRNATLVEAQAATQAALEGLKR